MSTVVRRDIQQLRGLAILLVVGYHAGGLLPSGFIGVDVFFVISGYVVARSVLSRIAEGNYSFSDFVRQRIRRILPALGLMLLVVLSLSTWMSTILARVQTVRTGIFAIFGSANLFLFRFRPDGYFQSSEKTNALLHTWSLSLEEQFYLVFAIAVTLLLRFAKRLDFARLATWTYLSVGVISFALCALASGNGVSIPSATLQRILGTESLDSEFAFYLPITRAWEFLIGVLIALNQPSQPAGRKVLATLLRVIGVCMIVLSGLLIPEDNFPGVWALCPTIGAGFVILTGGFGAGLPGQLGSIVSWIGDRSYGWYLWHWPIIQFVYVFSELQVGLILAAASALVPAALSYRYLEQPIRQNEFWRQPRRTHSLGIACLVLPLVAVALTRDPQPDLDHHLDVQLDCIYGEIAKLGEGGPCTLSIPNSAGVAVLIGDSHASHLSEAFVGAAHSLGFDALLASHANRPLLYLDEATKDGTSDGQRRLVRHVIERKVRLAVIAQSTYASTFEKGRSWNDAMRPVLEELTEAGVKVVLVAESIFVGADPQECSAIQIYLSVCDADITRSTDQLLNQRGRFREELELVKEFESVIHFDSARFLCPNPDCAIRRNGRWWWRDNGHISVFASLQLEKPLQVAMKQALEADR